jgi:hypothetical protein
MSEPLFEAAWRIIADTYHDGELGGEDSDLELVIAHARKLGLAFSNDLRTPGEATEDARKYAAIYAEQARLRHEIEKDKHIPTEVRERLASLTSDQRIEWWDKHATEWTENPRAVLAAAERG